MKGSYREFIFGKQRVRVSSAPPVGRKRDNDEGVVRGGRKFEVKEIS